MIEYKYTLDKSSKKFRCPNCEKIRFVRYFDNENKQYLNDFEGRCDRETNCGYHKKPNSNNCINSTFITSNNIISKPDFHQSDIVQKSMNKYELNNLFLYIKIHFSQAEINNCIDKYKIGTSKHWQGSTVFWQIDEKKNIRAGKIILFDKNTGKRVKQPFPHINWVHRILNIKNFNLEQCLFGLHLIKNVVVVGKSSNLLLTSKIAIVESEKTALVMSMFLPDYIWLATGSKQNYKRKLLEPLKDQQIVVFPDKGEFADWNKKTIELNNLGFKIKCSAFIENANCENGTDLADVYFQETTIKNQVFSEEIILTQFEKTVQKLAKINPEIINLISTFDLIDEKGNEIRIFQ